MLVLNRTQGRGKSSNAVSQEAGAQDESSGAEEEEEEEDADAGTKGRKKVTPKRVGALKKKSPSLISEDEDSESEAEDEDYEPEDESPSKKRKMVVVVKKVPASPPVAAAAKKRGKKGAAAAPAQAEGEKKRVEFDLGTIVKRVKTDDLLSSYDKKTMSEEFAKNLFVSAHIVHAANYQGEPFSFHALTITRRNPTTLEPYSFTLARTLIPKLVAKVNTAFHAFLRVIYLFQLLSLFSWSTCTKSMIQTSPMQARTWRT